MMNTKLTLSLIFTLLTGISAFAQNYVILVKPAGAKEWGYADLKGDLIIDAKCKNCIGFSEDGYAAVYDSKAKQFYFLDINGEKLQTEVKDFKLIKIFGFGMKGFNDGFAAVQLDEKWGFLNTDGKLAIPASYDKVTPFNSGFAAAQKGDKFFVLDHTGSEYPVDVPGIKDLNDFSEQLASFKTEDGKVGFVDGNGKLAIEAKFKATGDFHTGLAWAKNSDGVLGYINPKGDWELEPKFAAGKNFDPVTGLARVKLGDDWGYVNKSGKIIYMKDTEAFDDFFDGLAKGKNGGKFGFFNPKMGWSIQPKFDAARDFNNGYAAVKKGELWGVIDKAGEWVIQPKYDDIKDVEIIR